MISRRVNYGARAVSSGAIAAEASNMHDKSEIARLFASNGMK